MQTKQEIIQRLQVKLLELLGKNINPDTDLWELFPRGTRHREAKEVTEFVHFIAKSFKVLLTEEEWENITLHSLSELIASKQNNPDEMHRKIKKEMEDTRKGFRFTCYFLIIFGAGTFFIVQGNLNHRIVVSLTITFLMIICIYFAFYDEKKRIKSEIDLIEK